MDKGRPTEWQRRVREQRSVAAEIRQRAEELCARSRKLCAKSWRIQHRVLCVAVENSLALRLAIHEDHYGLLKKREMQVNNPVHPESTLTAGADSPAAAGDRFTSVPLSRSAIAFLKRSLDRDQLRRREYHAGQLRVCIDGEEGVQFDARVGAYTPFIVPLSASYLEIFGDDDDGALLLAVFPLPEPELVAHHQAEHMLVTLEGGQTVAIEMSLDYGTDGELRAYVIQLAYAESAEVDMQGAEHHAAADVPCVRDR